MKAIIIGRATDNDYVVNDRYVSKHHMQIVIHDNGQVSVVDLNSKTGTFVNGKKIFGEQMLNDIDVIKIGNTIIPWRDYVNELKVEEEFEEEFEEIETEKWFKKKKIIIPLIVLLLLGGGGFGAWKAGWLDKVFDKKEQTKKDKKEEKEENDKKDDYEKEGYATKKYDDFKILIHDDLEETDDDLADNEVLAYENDSMKIAVFTIDKKEFNKIAKKKKYKKNISGVINWDKKENSYPDKVKEKEKTINDLDAVTIQFDSGKKKKKKLNIIAYIDADDIYYIIKTQTDYKKKKKTKKILNNMINSFKLSDQDDDDEDDDEGDVDNDDDKDEDE